MNRRIFLQIIGLVIFTILVSGGLVYWSTLLNHSISSFHQSWQSETEVAIKRAELLAELERSFGYNSFIHHFKNYVLRQDEIYYEQALGDVEATRTTILRLQSMALSSQETTALAVIQHTFDEYTQMLALAKSKFTSRRLSSEAVDRLVKVDDTDAEAAFTYLRKSIGEKFELAKQKQSLKLDQTQKLSSTGVLLLLPIVLLFACLNIFTLIFVVKLINEKRKLFNSTPDAILYCDKDGRLTEVNKACTDLFGYQPQELLGMQLEDLVPEQCTGRHVLDREKFLSNSTMRRMTHDGLKIVGRHQSGVEIPVDIELSTVSVSKNDVFIAVIRDLRQEQELKNRAELDFLTQVMNRRKIEALLKEEVQRAIRYHRALSLLVIDVDNFKQLNDTAGHQDGDNALKEIGQFLREQARPSDHIGRWGGDEFVIICPETRPDAALNFAQRLVHEFVRFTSFGLTFSIGVAGYELIGESFNHKRCFEEADLALYESKNAGRDRASLYIAPRSSLDKKA
ncbi:sensor domain-containing diguanylate cyclase [Pseudoalteromonas sp. S2755]|uniref:sensor domain-containing diguanylate cyclase n=1 Tax=Pseudoalteromonas sp. S2755 TaxID=2066523 RepID=UPI00110BD1F1|nr:sensor domain-containing diguanylate cyclase [Pseudoalteromonas sp. S2755]TMN32699.1 sensor domain-containing diguanylate cyclase [Pseudoalteromonas sp. S2755]